MATLATSSIAGPPVTHEAPPIASNDEGLRLTNMLSKSRSPYVRGHMNNPVAWQEWNPETLALARKHQRLVFVSIGYAACHWCHVMERESFENNHIAALLNNNFIPIKIDREERPDVDRIYMNYVQATTGGGGWPLNVFLTPDLEPLFGGTYFPGPGSTVASGGGISFEQILVKMVDVWRNQRARCIESAREITAQLRTFAQEGQVSRQEASGTDALDIELLEEAYSHFAAKFDDEHGGFGSQPKFPTPANLQFLLKLGTWPREVRDVIGEEECDDAAGMVVRTLQAMSDGGIKDQIGHGFARYSVTKDWSLPHFEKMLYDQPQLLNTYLDGALINSTTDIYSPYLKTAIDIADYLTSPPLHNASGGFFSSEDADSLYRSTDAEKREGAFYVWTDRELNEVLPSREAQILAAYYGVEVDGNVAPEFDAQDELLGQNVLAIKRSPEELSKKFGAPVDEVIRILDGGKIKLREHREKERPRPALDDKIVTAWNGLAIGALARLASVLLTVPASSAPAKDTLQSAQFYLQSAVDAANFIHENLCDTEQGTLKRVYREGAGDAPGFADDYAFLIAGLIDLYEATFDDKWLQWADRLQKKMIELFWDEPSAASTTTASSTTPVTSTAVSQEAPPLADATSTQPIQSSPQDSTHGHGGFFSTSPAPDLLLRLKDGMDNAEPSTNGTAALNLFRLASLFEDESYRSKALQTIHAFEAEIIEHPFLFVSCLQGVVWSTLGGRAVTVFGGREEETNQVLGLLRGRVRPDVTLCRLDGEGVRSEWLRGRNPLLANVDLQAKKDGFVMVCERGACREGRFAEVEQLLQRQ